MVAEYKSTEPIGKLGQVDKVPPQEKEKSWSRLDQILACRKTIFGENRSLEGSREESWGPAWTLVW